MADDSKEKEADMPTNKELADQLATARKDIEALARMAGARATGEAGAAAGRVTDTLDGLSEETRAMYEAARKQGVALRHDAEDRVREHPLMATGLALFAGFLLANLMRR
jgi:ElaB/YqjD/DUF883 family membrane-anchored ribosome-binding protein